VSQSLDVKEKFLKEIKNSIPVNKLMIAKWESFSSLNRSNYPGHSPKPKPVPEPGPNSLQFCEG
jgi:hypothetical protein